MIYLIAPFLFITLVALATVKYTTTKTYRRRKARIAEQERQHAAAIAERAKRDEAKRKRTVKFEDAPKKHLYVNDGTGEVLETYDDVEVPGWRRV